MQTNVRSKIDHNFLSKAQIYEIGHKIRHCTYQTTIFFHLWANVSAMEILLDISTFIHGGDLMFKVEECWNAGDTIPLSNLEVLSLDKAYTNPVRVIINVFKLLQDLQARGTARVIPVWKRNVPRDYYLVVIGLQTHAYNSKQMNTTCQHRLSIFINITLNSSSKHTLSFSLNVN